MKTMQDFKNEQSIKSYNELKTKIGVLGKKIIFVK